MSATGDRPDTKHVERRLQHGYPAAVMFQKLSVNQHRPMALQLVGQVVDQARQLGIA
jgi:hypothetical protein